MIMRARRDTVLQRVCGRWVLELTLPCEGSAKRNEKAVVRDFYESFGWSTDSTGTYNDTAAFGDLRLIPDNLLGTVLLRIIYWLEEAFPQALARLGRYPMVLIQKTSG